MELDALRYFQKVAELEHMTRAAEEMHISQPAISQTIQTLERNLGCSLFDRYGKSIRLNDCGRIFKRYADSILDSLSDAKRELEQYSDSGNIYVSLSLRIGMCSLPEILVAFKKIFPNVRLDIAQHQYLLDDWHDSPCDLTLFSSMLPIREDNVMDLIEENILLAVPKSHRFAGLKEIDLQEAAHEEFILSAPSHSNLRTIISQYCNMVSFKPTVVMEVGGENMLLECVRAGLGISFVPEYSWQQSSSHDLYYVPIVNPSFKRHITISWAKNRFMSKGSILFKSFIIEYFHYGPGQNGGR